jgi:hypothetical protein
MSLYFHQCASYPCCSVSPLKDSAEAEFMNVQFPLRFLGIILRVLRLKFSVYNVYITNHFCSGGGGGYNLLVEVTENSKEKNFYSNYVQEFCLCLS